MANTNNPFGFLQAGLYGGAAAPTFGIQTCYIKSTNTNKIYTGDGVQLLTSVAPGYIDQAGVGVAASFWHGIFQGCKYYSTSQGKIVNSTYWPGSDATGDVTAYVQPLIGGPSQLFWVQSTLTAITQASVGRNVDISVGTGTISGAYGKSGMTVNPSTFASTATLPWTITDLYSNYAPSFINGADVTTSYNIVQVRFNGAQSTGF